VWMETGVESDSNDLCHETVVNDTRRGVLGVKASDRGVGGTDADTGGIAEDTTLGLTSAAYITQCKNLNISPRFINCGDWEV
jgi:hypothetical protein